MGAPNPQRAPWAPGPQKRDLNVHVEEAERSIDAATDAWDSERMDPALAELVRARVALRRALDRIDQLFDALVTP